MRSPLFETIKGGLLFYDRVPLFIQFQERERRPVLQAEDKLAFFFNKNALQITS